MLRKPLAFMIGLFFAISAAAESVDLETFFDAVSTGTVGEVETYLKHDPELAARQDEFGFSAIHVLDYIDFEAKLDLLITYGADINAGNHDGHTLTHILIDPEFLPAVLSRGADVNARDKYGRTPLMNFLTEPDSRELIEALLAAGADPESIDNQNRSIMDYARDYDQATEGSVTSLIQRYRDLRSE